MVFAAFIAFGALTTSAVAQAPNPPRLKSEATIHGDIVRIGDLIENSVRNCHARQHLMGSQQMIFFAMGQ